MLVYEQDSGRLLHRCLKSARPVAFGYAGAPGYVNDPSADHLRAKGPLPKGRYRIVETQHPRFARPAYYLRPEASNRMHGRSGFWIHGDNKRGNRSASTGCIVLDYDARQCIRPIVAGNDLLVVVATWSEVMALEAPPPPMPSQMAFAAI